MHRPDETSPLISQPHPFLSRHSLWLLALAVLGLGLWFFLLRAPAAVLPPPVNPWTGPVPVHTEAARQEDFNVQIQAIGTVTPTKSVTVRSRVAGQLTQVSFREGQQVRQGQLLAVIDPAPYRVKLALVRGQQQQNVAQLKVAESELARYRQLFTQDALARQQLERQEAMVQQLRGTLEADQAQVDEAQLNLSYTRIESPMDGRIGLRRVDEGNLVTANDANGLFTVLQTQPMAAVFSVPEGQVAAVRAVHAKGTAAEAQAWNREGRQLLARGRLDTADNQIDLATGTLKLKARFDNADDALFPNQFVNIRLELQKLQGAITIPAEAVQHGSRGSYVYVVVADKAQVRPIELGASSQGRTVVSKGLAAGDKVVLEGLDRLEDGREVTMTGVASGQVTAPASKR